jgi:AcrR family transcriptional regulator
MIEKMDAGSADAELLALLWGRRPVATRGPKANLGLDQIVAAALAIADAEGLEAVSMQAVAEALGYSKMSLYRHVATKDALLAVMIDAAIGVPPDLSGVEGGWRRRIEAYARALWATWQEHPWLPSATVGLRVMGPNEVGWVEQAVRALADTGLSGDERIDAVLLVSSHVRTTHSLASSGTFPWTADRQLSPHMTSLLREEAERFPAILDAVGSASPRPIRHVDDGLGLGCILDGLQLRIAERQG